MNDLEQAPGQGSSPTQEPASDRIETASPASRSRRLAFGFGGLGIGLILGITIGVAGGLLIPRGVAAVSAVAKPSRIPTAVTACDIVGNKWIVVGDGGSSVSMKSDGETSAGADIADLTCVLGELDVPDSVVSRIDATRALDGRQSATWKGLSASWGYHPDNGLDIVIETTHK